MGRGKERIADPDLREALRARSRRITIGSVLAAAVLTAIACLWSQ